MENIKRFFKKSENCNKFKMYSCKTKSLKK